MPAQADEIQVDICLFGVCKTYALFYSSSTDDVETFTTRDQGNVSEVWKYLNYMACIFSSGILI